MNQEEVKLGTKLVGMVAEIGTIVKERKKVGLGISGFAPEIKDINDLMDDVLGRMYLPGRPEGSLIELMESVQRRLQELMVEVLSDCPVHEVHVEYPNGEVESIFGHGPTSRVVQKSAILYLDSQGILWKRVVAYGRW